MSGLGMSCVKPPIVCVVGPTGTGKSALAVQIAQRVQGEIVNCDSRQVYSDFPCITAQPGAEDHAQCAHHLYGFLPTHEAMHAGRFMDLARQKIEELRCRKVLPILVGGTGLYLRALIYGLAPIPRVPPEVHDQIQRECAVSGPQALHRRLQTVDAQSAARIHPRDGQRITRALEVHAATGRSLSWWMRTYPCDQPRYSALVLGLESDLQSLVPRLEHRIERMCTQGALQEVERAWINCPQESAPGWTGIGCWDLLQAYLGKATLAEAKDIWLKKTRAYAKRQLTWFRKEKGILWCSELEEETVIRMVWEWMDPGCSIPFVSHKKNPPLSLPSA